MTRRDYEISSLVSAPLAASQGQSLLRYRGLAPCVDFLSSHINAQTPGSIHEGGELGYALSVAYGAVMDKPDLIACCVVGDGEAETGPTAT